MSREIGKNIRRLRMEKGMTQEELAQQLHVTRQAVSLWETGKSLPDVEMLQSVGELFGQDLQSLLGSVPTAGEKRRRVLKIAGLAGVMALGLAVLLALEAVMEQTQFFHESWFTRLRWWEMYFIRQAICAMWGVCAVRILVAAQGRWQRKRWQNIVFVVCAVLMGLYTLSFLSIFGLDVKWPGGLWQTVGIKLTFAFDDFTERAYLFVILGLGLGLGWRKKDRA